MMSMPPLYMYCNDSICEQCVVYLLGRQTAFSSKLWVKGVMLFTDFIYFCNRSFFSVEF